MDVAVVGTGFIGGTLGRALATAGHSVSFGSRHPDDDGVAQDSGAAVRSVADALAAADVVIVAVPSAAIGEFAAANAEALRGKLVVDATNKMGDPVANSRADLPADIRYARAFNTLGGENLAAPAFGDGPADMFFSSGIEDRGTLEELIGDVGLRPVYVGADQEALIDALFHLWIALAIGQGRGRRLGLRLLEA